MIYAIALFGYIALCFGCWILVASGKLKRFSTRDIIKADRAKRTDEEFRALMAEFDQMEREKEWLR